MEGGAENSPQMMSQLPHTGDVSELTCGGRARVRRLEHEPNRLRRVRCDGQSNGPGCASRRDGARRGATPTTPRPGGHGGQWGEMQEAPAGPARGRGLTHEPTSRGRGLPGGLTHEPDKPSVGLGGPELVWAPAQSAEPPGMRRPEEPRRDRDSHEQPTDPPPAAVDHGCRQRGPLVELGDDVGQQFVRKSCGPVRRRRRRPHRAVEQPPADGHGSGGHRGGGGPGRARVRRGGIPGPGERSPSDSRVSSEAVGARGQHGLNVGRKPYHPPQIELPWETELQLGEGHGSGAGAGGWYIGAHGNVRFIS